MPTPDVQAQLKSLAAVMVHGDGIPYDEAVNAFRRQYLLQILQAHRDNQQKAAAAMGIHRNTLSRAIASLDLSIVEVRKYSRQRSAVSRQL
jgi:DNA-binding NtrC family response regulator